VAGIITIAELEAALGRTLVGDQIAQAQYFIDGVSSYVETYTGVTFTLHENEVVRQQADYYGELALAPEPIIAVGDVTAVHIPSCTTFYGYDGLNTLYNLEAHGVYDVVLTYGYETPPTDIKTYVTEQVRFMINNPNNLSQYRVGDVTETYNTKDQTDDVMSVAGLGQDTLDSYKRTEQTWKLGPRSFPGRSPNLPTL